MSGIPDMSDCRACTIEICDIDAVSPQFETEQSMSTQSTLQILIVCAALSVGSLAKSDIITDWNTAALQAIRADNTPPPKASRALAILHASIYDAVNGIVRVHKPYFVEEKGPLTASQEAAASAAAFKVLVSLFPNGAQSFEQLHESILEEIRAVRASTAVWSGANQLPRRSSSGEPQMASTR